MTKHTTFALLLLLTQCLSAQNTTDRTQIETVIQSYFDGWFTGDTTKVGSAMHASCRLKFYRDSFTEMSRATYLGRFKPTTRQPNTDARIVHLDITDNIASAKCEIETPKFIFTDYFNLLRVQDRWYIIDKVSTRIEKKPLEPTEARRDSMERVARALAQAQLDAYNARDIEAFVKPYADSVKVHGFPNQVYYQGVAKMHADYKDMFEKTPNLHCELLGRIAIGNYIIDRERVTFAKDRPALHAVAIYRVVGGKIAEVWFL